MKRFLLIDCNNFFVSCERVFNPKLRNKPVVILSSNDACVIARSNEAKALGIPMGAPAFEYKNFFKQKNVIVYSANFGLYADMSARVMKTLALYASQMEIYSIDEAFLFIPERQIDDIVNKEHFNNIYYTQYGLFLKNKVMQNTGIPICVGIGKTKTMAKIANQIAKKQNIYNGVFDISSFSNCDEILEQFKVEDIWGIGRRYSNLLKSKGIVSAKDFKNTDEKWVKKNMTVVGLKTLLELKDQPCLNIQELSATNKSIVVSRSFGRNITSLFELKEAVATYMCMAAQKLRNQFSSTKMITVFVMFKKYQDSYKHYDSCNMEIPIATFYTSDLINYAHSALEKIYKQGFEYKKAGVMLSNFVLEDHIQLNLYANDNLNKKRMLIKAMDNINNIFGKNKVTFLGSGTKRLWAMRQLKKSQNFTTSWHEILTINA